MIYFVDEDFGDFHPYSLALEMQGFDVLSIPNASSGLSKLSTILREEVDLVFIDVMLARGSDANGNFPEDDPKDGLETGLRLLDLLARNNPTCFPTRAILLSAAEDPDLVASIELCGRRHKIPFWPKTRFPTPADFVSDVVAYLEGLD